MSFPGKHPPSDPDADLGGSTPPRSNPKRPDPISPEPIQPKIESRRRRVTLECQALKVRERFRRSLVTDLAGFCHLFIRQSVWVSSDTKSTSKPPYYILRFGGLPPVGCPGVRPVCPGSPRCLFTGSPSYILLYPGSIQYGNIFAGPLLAVHVAAAPRPDRNPTRQQPVRRGMRCTLAVGRSSNCA